MDPVCLSSYKVECGVGWFLLGQSHFCVCTYVYVCIYIYIYIYTCIATIFLLSLESLRVGQFSIDIEVFNTSVDSSNINTHSPLHDNRHSFPTLKYLHIIEIQYQAYYTSCSYVCMHVTNHINVTRHKKTLVMYTNTPIHITICISFTV